MLFAIIIVVVGVRFFNKSDYQKITGGFTNVNVKKIEKNLENKTDFVLYIGRETCPACVDFVPILDNA